MVRLNTLRKRLADWMARHGQALDIAFIVFLVTALGGNLRNYLDSPPWGWLSIVLLFVVTCARVYALGWGLGYVKSARRTQALLDAQNEVLKLQAERLKLQKNLSLPTVAVDESGHLTINVAVSSN
jgi:hypothetical protein